MAKVLVTESNLSNIADAIRTKNGQTSATYTPAQMAPAILAIPTGGGSVSLQNKSATPSETAQTITFDAGYDGLRQVSIAGITSTYVGSGIVRRTSSDITNSNGIITATSGYYENNATLTLTTKGAATYTPTTSNQTIAAGQYLTGAQTIEGDADLISSNIKHDVNIFNVTGTFGMKMESIISAPDSRGTTISFTGLKAQPKAFACNLEFEGSFTSARTVYSLIYDGTTLSNCTSYRSGSTMLCYKYTTCTWSYNNGTLTITSPSTSSVGYFQPYDYHLIYFYEE